MIFVLFCFVHSGNVLVTGGAGYIGSHACVELINAGYEIVVVDDLRNSKFESIRRVEKITNRSVKFYELDLRNFDKLKTVFEENEISSVIHFASLKVAGESVFHPIDYYENNVGCSISLLKCVKKYRVKDFVFSSSVIVYGSPEYVPIKEDCPTNPICPYGNTKVVIENMLKDIVKSDPSLGVVILRYFNAVGSYSSYTIGEDPNGIPTFLFPYITQVAVGKLKRLRVYGNDYSTPDGTCVRDFTHVVDIAKGHVLALRKLRNTRGVLIYNLGTGKGTSVMEALNTFVKVTGVVIPYEIVGKRTGDVPRCYANADLALKELGWKAELGLESMCLDHYLFQVQNPNGYKSVEIKHHIPGDTSLRNI